MPFVVSPDDPRDPEVVLAVVAVRRFKLLSGFGYVDQDGVYWPIPPQPAAPPGADDRDDRYSTDLASVPPPLWSLLSSYGRQTRPALLHDHLSWLALDRRDAGREQAGFAFRSHADALFRQSLGEVGVSPSRSRVFWAGVTLGKYLSHGTVVEKLVGLVSLLLVLAGWLASYLLLVTLLAGDVAVGAIGWALGAWLVGLGGWLASSRLRADVGLWLIAWFVVPVLAPFLLVWLVAALWIGLPGWRPGTSLRDLLEPFSRGGDHPPA